MNDIIKILEAIEKKGEYLTANDLLNIAYAIKQKEAENAVIS